MRGRGTFNPPIALDDISPKVEASGRHAVFGRLESIYQADKGTPEGDVSDGPVTQIEACGNRDRHRGVGPVGAVEYSGYG